MADVVSVTGFILSSMPVGDYDRRVVILSRELGKIAAFAKGARRPNSHLIGVTRPFIFGTFEVYRGRDSYTIQKANVTNYFEELVSDLDGVLYGYYFAELAEYYGRRMMVELYLMWALNGVLRFVQIWNSEEQMKLLQGFAWVVMICIVYAVAVYMVNESISTHYREVCHDLHHENRLHTKLYQQSTVDSTTGILNRNAYNNYVIEYKEGNCDSISCIYIDVNGLHEYNNTYGHQAGDKMLKTVAAELKECFAEHSHYRIGGDEFVIICENTAFKSILMQLNHFREQMKIHNIYIASGMEWRDENMNLADMIKKADAKMYRDKERFYKAFPNARECGMLYQNAVE